MKIKFNKLDGEIVCMGAIPNLSGDGVVTDVIDHNGEVPADITHFKVDGVVLREKNTSEKKAMYDKKTAQKKEKNDRKRALMVKLGINKEDLNHLIFLIKEGVED